MFRQIWFLPEPENCYLFRLTAAVKWSLTRFILYLGFQSTNNTQTWTVIYNIMLDRAIPRIKSGIHT